jgi:hypothetical protein
MNSEQTTVILKRFEAPDEVRVLKKGRFELVHLGGMTIGRATYEPGWKWSEHVGPSVGATRCRVERVGLVLSGTATAAFDDEAGNVIETHFLLVRCALLRFPFQISYSGPGSGSAFSCSSHAR